MELLNIVSFSYFVLFLSFQELIRISILPTVHPHDIDIGWPRGDNMGLKILILNTGG